MWICPATATVVAGAATAAWAGPATSMPAIAAAGAALPAFSAAFSSWDGAACLPVRLTFGGRRCLGAEFTALP